MIEVMTGFLIFGPIVGLFLLGVWVSGNALDDMDDIGEFPEDHEDDL